MDKLLIILEELRPDVDFKNEKKLIDNGVLDSFDIVSLIGELNDQFDIDISADEISAENFNSAEAMMEMINRFLEQ